MSWAKKDIQIIARIALKTNEPVVMGKVATDH